MATIKVMDPVTRIEGHMKVEITVDTVGGVQQVTNAKCTGTLFRGFETILTGRDPKDAPIITTRICGVCPVSHAMASSMALDAAAKKTISANARILRNLTLGANFIQSHILHFYLLAALDYATGPGGAPFTPAWTTDMRGLNLTNSMVKAIEARRVAHQMGSVFGGRMPTPHTYVPGGFTAVPNSSRISTFRGFLTSLRSFIQNTYIPDVQMVANVYDDFLSIGKGHGNLMAYGVFDLTADGSSKLLKRGVVNATAPTTVATLDTNLIKESVTYSWYDNATNNLGPAGGKTTAVDPATKTSAYSWLKAPRYNGKPMEAGPLARMWVNGDYRRGVSVMDRHLARAQEALKIANAMDGWLNQLQQGGSVYSNYTTPSTGTGTGLTEAARGALGHWVNISGGKISNYQIITPTCWNASPKDTSNANGPMEKALIGTPISNIDEPIEALRVIHSYDPCLSCAVHVMRPKGKPVVIHTGCK
ncbi:MAG: nickel-dependent hydrogenase large subunit [Acidobacteriota bacterium]